MVEMVTMLKCGNLKHFFKIFIISQTSFIHIFSKILILNLLHMILLDLHHIMLNFIMEILLNMMLFSDVFNSYFSKLRPSQFMQNIL